MLKKNNPPFLRQLMAALKAVLSGRAFTVTGPLE